MFVTFQHIPLQKMVAWLLMLVAVAQNAFAQHKSVVAEADLHYYYKHASYYKKDSNHITFYFVTKTACKGYVTSQITFGNPGNGDGKRKVADTPAIVPFLQLHGNISYTFDYRSRLDTPFIATNLQQHNEQVYADAVFKGRYPFRVILNARQSNSPYFKNYTDINIQFNHQAYQQRIKDEMIAAVSRKMPLLDSIAKYESLINEKKREYFAQKSWVDDPARMQEIMHEKEQVYSRYTQMLALKTVDTIKGSKAFRDTIVHPGWTKDSLLAFLQGPTSVEKNIRTKQKLIDSLGSVIQTIQKRKDSLQSVIGNNIADQVNKIKNASSLKELRNAETEAATGILKTSDKNLLSIRQFGIGRTTLNYSELTVNNVSLNGINIEYNPAYYAAFATGSVDYLFRDFVLQPGKMPRQKIVLGRFGFGNTEKRSFIFTVYNGTKNSFGGTVSDTSAFFPRIKTTHIFGYSLEVKYKIAKNTDASFEFAKSSSPYGVGGDRDKSMADAFSFSNRNNEAWSAKVDIAIPRTESAINVFYKQIGANFQSYNIYNTGNRQVGWGIKWKQYFLKDQLSITAQIRKSNIDDPLIPATFNSAIIFKSIQAVYRKKKWPVLSVGYMPTTQLIKSADGFLYQSIYYALSGNAFYSYTLLKLSMTSSLMYSRFYNKGTDRGFVLYNAQSVLYSHNIDIGRLHSQTDAQYTQQPGFAYWTFQQRLDVQVTGFLTLGAGVKNNVIAGVSHTLWGGSGQADIRIKQLGSLRLQYEKGYLPTNVNGLMPNNWGRAIWYTVF